MFWLGPIALIALIASGAICFFILATLHVHGHLTADTADGPQNIHDGRVPRIGGIAILGALVLGVLCSAIARTYLVFDGLLLIACLLPAFMAGLYEDLAGQVRPLRRYLATVLTAACFVIAFEVSVTRVSIPGVDQLLVIGAVSMLFTCFAVASVAHAFNLIDGENGLCSGITLITCAALVWVSLETRQALVFTIALMMAAANIGFLLFNYPHGKIFLGDAGAYLNGAVAAILSVMVVEGSAGQVSPWFPVALLAYPIWETLFSMLRRKFNGRGLFDPDGLHLHSALGRLDRHAQSCIHRVRSSAPRIWLLSFAPVMVAAFGYAHTGIMVGVVLAFIVAYQMLYWGVMERVDQIPGTEKG